jgi:hypothetical protein
MPYSSTPYGRATPEEVAVIGFEGWPARRAGGLRPSSTPSDSPRRTPMPSFPPFSPVPRGNYTHTSSTVFHHQFLYSILALHLKTNQPISTFAVRIRLV